VIVLHGGPAAGGSAAPIARGLADAFRVLEPWQRGSGPEPLTVARHVADLHEIVELCRGRTGMLPALVGESWGAMLALAYAAAHPDRAGPIVLVGCGTWDKASRARLLATRQERITPEMAARLAEADACCMEPGRRAALKHEITQSIDAYAPLSEIEPVQDENDRPPAFDLEAHLQTWNDMIRLQEQGDYPAAFAAIRSPVLMIHGNYDPHPGPMIRDSLLPYLPQLEYHELARCGHCPWNERYARGAFFAVLREWLGKKAVSYKL
jgi:pimeloyl-ACP methyl ester carboxylesterase